jgi:hypothetical protein
MKTILVEWGIANGHLFIGRTRDDLTAFEYEISFRIPVSINMSESLYDLDNNGCWWDAVVVFDHYMPEFLQWMKENIGDYVIEIDRFDQKLGPINIYLVELRDAVYFKLRWL